MFYDHSKTILNPFQYAQYHPVIAFLCPYTQVHLLTADQSKEAIYFGKREDGLIQPGSEEVEGVLSPNHRLSVHSYVRVFCRKEEWGEGIQ